MTKFQEDFVIKVCYYVSCCGIAFCWSYHKWDGMIMFSVLTVVSLAMLLKGKGPTPL